MPFAALWLPSGPVNPNSRSFRIGPDHSRTPRRNRAVACSRKFRQSHLRPSDRPANVPGHASDSSRHRHSRYSLPDCSPLPLAQIGSPQMPALLSRIIFFNTPLLGVHRACCRSHLSKIKSGRGLASRIRNACCIEKCACRISSDSKACF